jgi:hypothetical protein
MHIPKLAGLALLGGAMAAPAPAPQGDLSGNLVSSLLGSFGGNDITSLIQGFGPSFSRMGSLISSLFGGSKGLNGTDSNPFVAMVDQMSNGQGPFAGYLEAARAQSKGGSPILEGISGLMGMAGKAAPLLSIIGVDASKIELNDMLCDVFDPNGKMAFLSKPLGNLFGNPWGPDPSEKCEKDTSGGSGPYKTKVFEDSTLVNHTIYVPENPPADLKLPVIAWANGFCLPAGLMFNNFLAEIASHGYLVIANGRMKPGLDLGGVSAESEQVKAVDWALGPNGKKYGNIDASKVAVAGQSCGGINAVSRAMMINPH